MKGILAPERLLIVLFGAIGDVVRGLPLAQRIRAGWPDTEIAWAVEGAAAPMLENHPAIDRVIVFGRSLRAIPPLLREVRDFRPDVSLDLQRLFKSGLASWGSRAPRRIGFHWNNTREGSWFFGNQTIAPVDHLSAKIDQFLLFADLLGVPDCPVSFGLRPLDSDRRRVDELLAGVNEPFAAFFVGASWETKLWHAAPAGAVVDRLGERGMEVVLLGGPGDCEVAREIAAASRHDPVDLTGRTSLRDIVGVLERAAVALGPDSGPMHIAAAVGVPVVGLFGATSPKRSAPYGFEHLVVEGDAPCRPCYSKRCPIDRECMKAISAEVVVAKIDEALHGNSTRLGSA